MPKKKTFKPRKSQKWFADRIGKYITKNCASDLFNPEILILSENHAKALHATQDNGHRYHI